MIKIKVKITKDTLEELRGCKDFWSEVVFRDGYELAPTCTMSDLRALDQFLALESIPKIDYAWPYAEPATIVWNEVFVPLTSRMPVSSEWDAITDGCGPKALAA